MVVKKIQLPNIFLIVIDVPERTLFWTDNLCFSINGCNIADCSKNSIVSVFLIITLIV